MLEASCWWLLLPIWQFPIKFSCSILYKVLDASWWYLFLVVCLPICLHSRSFSAWLYLNIYLIKLVSMVDVVCLFTWGLACLFLVVCLLICLHSRSFSAWLYLNIYLIKLVSMVDVVCLFTWGLAWLISYLTSWNFRWCSLTCSSACSLRTLWASISICSQTLWLGYSCLGIKYCWLSNDQFFPHPGRNFSRSCLEICSWSSCSNITLGQHLLCDLTGVNSAWVLLCTSSLVWNNSNCLWNFLLL